MTASDVRMPRLSDSMTEGTILKWLKGDGDHVASGDELVEIETDKANMVYEAEDAGILAIIATEGNVVAVGELIGRLSPAVSALGAPPEEKARYEERDAQPAAEPASPAASKAAEDKPRSARELTLPAQGESVLPPTRPIPRGVATSVTAGKVRATPLARRMAGSLGLDLAGLSPSGPGGRIVLADVERARPSGVQAERSRVQATPQTPSARPATSTAFSDAARTSKGEMETVELTKLQETVARRMAESKATAPHFYLQVGIDMSQAVAGRHGLGSADSGEGVTPSINDLVVRAVAIALREFPRANGAYRDGRLELYSRVNVGIAVAANGALVVPTIFDADQKGLREIARETRALAERVRNRSITPPELSGGTFTVSNLGTFGMNTIGPVLNPPQAAILGVGKVADTPVVREGRMVAAQVMAATLVCDHRALYGADGAQLLDRIRSLLESPLGLAL